MGKCLICQSETRFLGKNQGFNIYQCLGCGLGFTNELKSQIGDYHRDDEYVEEETLFKNIFLKRVNIISNILKPGKVLEVGCSTGLMLSLLKSRGWDATGVEISQKAAQKAQDRGIKVISKPFENIEIKDKFDVVIFNHTLEHLENPISVIKKVYLMLKTRGLIFIDLPNFNSLSAKIRKNNWPLLLPNEHKWHFTLKSLKLLLEKEGFKVVFVDRSSGIWDYGNPLLGLSQSLINLKKRFLGEFFTALPTWIISSLGLGSDLMVIAKKR